MWDRRRLIFGQREHRTKERPNVERASSTDSAFLAMDTGKVPHQFAVILILERSADFSLH
jgi:hypothetical protein